MAKNKHQLSESNTLEPEPAGAKPAKDKNPVKDDAKSTKSTNSKNDDAKADSEAEPKTEAKSDSSADKKPGKEPTYIEEPESDAEAAVQAAPKAADADINAKSPEAPPPPPRPKLERKESSFTLNLKESSTAFPNVDADSRRAVLVAASNNLEAAFTGMLALSDPTIRPAKYVKEQIENDEQLARKLAMSDQRRLSEQRRASRDRQSQQPRRYRPSGSYIREQPMASNDGSYEDEYGGRRESEESIYDGLQKGLNDTKQVVSSLWGNLKSRINGELDESEDLYIDDAYEQPHRGYDRRLPERRQNSSTGAGLGIRNDTQVPPGAPSDGPQLPPRRVSTRDSNMSTGSRSTSERKAREPKKEPSDAAPPAKESRSVNAFGDEHAEGNEEDQEPDAFFIGESDDDLGSSNEENLEEEAKESAKESAKSAKPEGKDENKSKDVAKDAAKDTAKNTDKDVKSESKDKATDDKTKSKDEKSEDADEKAKKDSEARSLLNKMKNESEKK